MSDLNLLLGADGYSQSISVATESYLAVQVGGDDTATWKLQGTLRDRPTLAIHWFDLDDDDGASTRSVEALPVKIDVDRCTSVRVVASDNSKVTSLHLKRLSGI